MSFVIEKKIGFDRIREMVRQHCISPLGERLVADMCFMPHFSDIQHSLWLVQELQQLRLSGTTLPENDFFDLQTELSRIRLDGTFMDIEALFDFVRSMQVIGMYVHFFVQREDSSPLWHAKAQSFTFQKNIWDAGRKLIDDKGNIRDGASDNLASVRAQIRRKQIEIDGQMRKMLSVAKREGWANAETEISLRNGRPVIPLLASHKRKLKGLLHDESSTGLTAFVEPAEVVELNNDLRLLEMEERREIVRLLTDFTISMHPHIDDLLHGYQFLSEVDFVYAKVKFAEGLQATIPHLLPYPHVDWFDAKHPLLYLKLKEQQRTIVPLQLQLNDKHRILIISGPNAGGKSVCMQTVGLLQYMLQCGLPVPLKSTSEMGVFDRIFIDMGDEQSLEDDLSTYSSHLQKMKHFLEATTDKSLFLIDEFGGGTDPHIGGAIAAAVLESLHARKPFGVVTTHYSLLKTLPETNAAMVNGAMLFDHQKLLPRYELLVGNPGSSFAFEIARNIGLSENILQRAAEMGAEKQLDFEQQLQNIAVEKAELTKKQVAFTIADEMLDQLVTEYQRKNEAFEKQKNEWIIQAKEEAKEIISTANKQIENTIAAIKKAQAEKEATKQSREQLQSFVKTLETPFETTKRNVFSNSDRNKESKKKGGTKTEKPIHHHVIIDNTPIKAGDFVQLGEGNHVGEVQSKNAKTIMVISNGIKVAVPTSQVQKINKEAYLKQKQPQQAKPKIYGSVFDNLDQKRASFSARIDVRGMRVDELTAQLQELFDNAILLGEHHLHILHGKGFGVLKNVVRDFFSAQPEVIAMHGGDPNKEGEGVTVIQLR